LADAYLNIAEMILGGERRPLKPREIIQRAYVNELLPWHLHGSRQDKTLHARLSEDIARSPEKSRFYRTGPGTFFLQQLRRQPETPDAFREVYLAPPRRKELKRDDVFSVRVSDIGAEAHSAQIPLLTLNKVLKAGNYAYRPYARLKTAQGYAVVHSFVVVFKNNQVLSFRCGKFFPQSDPLYGRRSIGIGGAVIQDDVDLLYESMSGIIENGITELGYGIGLPQRMAEAARYGNELKPYLGFLLDDIEGAPTVLHVVLGYRCPNEFEPSKAALSVNDLRWVDANNPGNDLQDYDPTSKRLFEGRHVVRIMQGQIGS